MSSCANCFAPVDGRGAILCPSCQKPLHKECSIEGYCDVCFTVKEEGGEQVQHEIPNVIRRSYIELYKSCPYAFYLTVIKGMETETSSFAQIGIDLHEFFEEACSKMFRDAEVMKREYKSIFDSYEDKLFEQDLHLYKDMNLQDFKSKMWKQSCDAIDTFFSILETLPSNAFALEDNIIFDVGDDLPKVSITMDRVDEVNGELEVCDWKTGQVMVGQKLSSDLQAPLYIYAIRSHFNKSVRKFTFYYLPENKVRVFEKIDEDNYECIVNKRTYKINITDAIRNVQSTFAQIKKGNFNIPRDSKGMYFKCKTCHYKRTETCRGADVEGWKQYNGN